ncbi:MAG: HEAT repeat domain-containing protein, partial [Gemmataceae bacterium]|nr:HEAT repeat domain-containing protein [Gemmataceae bacterium]
EEASKAKGKKGAKDEGPGNAFVNGMPALSLPTGPGAMGAGMPSGMSNAFTQGGNPRPIPSDMGGPWAGPGAFGPRASGPMPPMAPQGMEAALAMHHQAMMAQHQAMLMQGQMHPMMMHPAMMPVPMHAMPHHSPTPGLLAALRSAPLPSEREMAADGLRRTDWKAEGEVVPALLHAAQHDPAPMVRAASLRVLGQLKANTLPVMDAMEQSKKDADPRVRHQAEETAAALKGSR